MALPLLLLPKMSMVGHILFGSVGIIQYILTNTREGGNPTQPTALSLVSPLFLPPACMMEQMGCLDYIYTSEDS